MKYILIFLSLVLSASMSYAQQTLEIQMVPQPVPLEITMVEPAPAPQKPIQIHITPIVNADPNLKVTVQGAGAVADCVGCKTSPSLAPNPIATIEETAEHLNKINGSVWANACGGFIDNGKIGAYGELIRSEISKPGQLMSIKNGDQDLAGLCPNYPVMDDSSKANVFLLIMTSMAFEESSCDNNQTARGPNGTLKGFFQLHLGKEASYGPECRNYDSRTPTGSIMCAMSVINKQMGSGNLFRQETNYWDVLRPQRWNPKTKRYIPNPSYAKIRSAISKFAPCTDKQSNPRTADVSTQLFQVMDNQFYNKSINIGL